MALELLVDREITGAASAFDCFGRVRLFEGRELRAADLGATEVLLVRSVTRVDGALLEGSRVRFVGTATAGTDHVDTAWLADRGIAFSDAPGCNARAVAEHVACCLYAFAAQRGCAPADLSLGIVGFGQVGSALYALATALGIACRVNDPPLGEHARGVDLVTLDAVLACDVVSLHVPLTSSGPHATRNLLDAGRIADLQPGTLVINAARGGVLDEAALVTRLRRGELVAAIDCWVDEPGVDADLLAMAGWATPHIAGHSHEARARASELLWRALARWLGKAAKPPVMPLAAPPPPPLTAPGSLGALLETVHPLAAHSTRLRRLAALDAAARGAGFDVARRQHGLRWQCAGYTVAWPGADADTVRQLAALGFDTAADT